MLERRRNLKIKKIIFAVRELGRIGRLGNFGAFGSLQMLVEIQANYSATKG